MPKYIDVDNFFSEPDCLLVEEAIRTLVFEPGKMTVDGKSQVRTDIRNNHLAFAPPTLQPLIDKTYAKIVDINAKIFQAEITSPFRGEIVRYAEGESFNWHDDDPMWTPRTPYRKFTAVVQISDPSDYTGGTLKIRDVLGEASVRKARGKLSIFPSCLSHCVTPVLSGLRYSFVTFALGPPWR